MRWCKRTLWWMATHYLSVRKPLSTLCSGVIIMVVFCWIFYGNIVRCTWMYNVYNQRPWSGQPQQASINGLKLRYRTNHSIYEGRSRVLGLGVLNINNHYFAGLLSSYWRGDLWMQKGSFDNSLQPWLQSNYNIGHWPWIGYSFDTHNS